MQYRRFGQLDWQVSALGFGCMRFPTTDGKPLSPEIDEAEAIRMVRHGIDQGINYVDTAYLYHGGRSEFVVGKALKDGYRERVKLATKLPLWFVESEADVDRLLNEQLDRLQTDHIDFYLLHALNYGLWRDKVAAHNVLERVRRAKADGRIRHIGFSFHEEYDLLPEVLNGFDDWTFCQIQYNYMDTENQAGTRGLRLAAERGLAVVIMEPLLGGRLAAPPRVVLDRMEAHPRMMSAPEWALQWLWDQPEVSVVLSGMSDFAQLEQNLASAGRSGVATFDTADYALIDAVRTTYRERMVIPCTKCSYCMPCPTGVNIPKNFELYNDAFLHDNVWYSQFGYRAFLNEDARAARCIACGTCEAHCPQQIAISEWMPKVDALLAGDGSAGPAR